MPRGEDKKVRYAVVGAGNIAQVAVLPAFQHAAENSELGAIVSSDRIKRRELSTMYHDVPTGTYDELESLLESERIDAAYVATPNSTHRELVERLARAGVHVLCEKPLAMTTADCEAMIEAASGVKLMVAYRLHFEPANLEAIRVVREGVIGDVSAFSAVFTHDVRPGDIRTRAETGGGALFDLGIYCLNAARNLFCSEPIEVMGFSRANDEQAHGVDSATTAILRFGDDRTAQFTVSQSVADVSTFRVVGKKGNVRLDPAFDYANELELYLTVDGETKHKTFKKHDQFAPELLYFSQCILDDEEPEPSGEEGLADVRVLEAIARSAATGVPVRLPEFHRSRYADPAQRIVRPGIKKPRTVRAPSPSR